MDRRVHRRGLLLCALELPCQERRAVLSRLADRLQLDPSGGRRREVAFFVLLLEPLLALLLRLALQREPAGAVGASRARAAARLAFGRLALRRSLFPQRPGRGKESCLRLRLLGGTFFPERLDPGPLLCGIVGDAGLLVACPGEQRGQHTRHLPALRHEDLRYLGMQNERFCVAFDLETDSGVPRGHPPGTRDDFLERIMQFTVACAVKLPSSAIENCESPETVIEKCERHSWWRDVADRGCSPVAGLLDLFDQADVIVGYNCLQFDFPVLRRFYRMGARSTTDAESRYTAHRAKTLDVMLRVRDATGCFVKLDSLLASSGLECKSGNGAAAIALWEGGKRAELEAYCAKDVEVTARLALQEQLALPSGQVLPHQVHGLRSALAAKKAAARKKRERAEEDGFVIV